MCRMATRDFVAAVTAPAAARGWINSLLTHWEAPSLMERANLLTSEVVSNAVRHAQSDFTITTSMDRGFLEVGVTDRNRDGVPLVLSTEGRESRGWTRNGHRRGPRRRLGGEAASRR